MVNLSGKGKNNLVIYIYLFITLIFFSSFEIISKKIELNSISLTGIRFFFGGILIFILFLRKIISEYKTIDFKSKIQIFLSGFINVCVAMLSLQFAVKIGNATTSAIIISSNPIFVFIIQILFLSNFNKMNSNSQNCNDLSKTISIFNKNLNILNFIKLFLLLIGILGVILVIYKKDKGDNIYSILLALFASTSFAVYTIMTKNLLKKISALTLNSLSFTINGLILILISFIFMKNDLINFINNINIEILIKLSILSFGVTGLAYITYFYALKRLDAINVSLVFYLKPIVVLFLNNLILHELVGSIKLLGIFIVLISLLVFVNLEKLLNIIKIFFKKFS